MPIETKKTPKADQQKALDEIQKWFISRPSRKKFKILSGYAGTGKSTLLGWLQETLKLNKEEIIFSAFTGKATHVLKKNGLKAVTLHRLLYETRQNKKTGEYFSRLKPKGISERLVVVDEASMLSEKLFNALMSINGNFCVLFVGDNAQLPPINSNFNIMEKPHIKLTKVLRQAALNPIIRLATDIRNDKAWKIEDVIYDDMGYSKITNEALEEAIKNRFQNDAFLCSTNKDRVFYNEHLRKEIHKNKKKNIKIVCKDDRLIILDNCAKQMVFNGQLFTVDQFKFINKHKMVIRGKESDIEDSEEISISAHPYNFLNPKPLDRLEVAKKYGLDFKKVGIACDYAYCLTVHKSQGSEFENVFLKINNQDRRIWKEQYNRWLYTAVTRASKRLYFVEE